jgi:hypothetical protein
MPIVVRIQDERGTADGNIWVHDRSTAVLVGDHPGTCCLRFIDPYGDAIFNQQQIPVLIAELEAYSSRTTDRDGRVMLRHLIKYLVRALDRLHMYVCFSGD